MHRLAQGTFGQHIAERLRAAILASEIGAGAQLVEGGLLVTVAHTGTHVISLSVQDVREIYSMRIRLNRFAFEQSWRWRDDVFARGCSLSFPPHPSPRES